MPTKRFTRLSILALVLYIFANQTQVGWLYVIMSLLVGVIFISWRLNRRAIHSLSAVREIDYRDSYTEGETLEISLGIDTSSPIAGRQLRLDELCPVADPQGDHFLQQWYLPHIPTVAPQAAPDHSEAPSAVELNYTVELYKRGLFEFPAVEITSRFPFGIFQRSNYSEKMVADSGLRILVYPEVRPLSRLPLLDQQPTAQMIRPHAGNGNEFLALRQYRYGDSPRHIHWRSVARTGRLISKEFADESLPGMALVLQRQTAERDPAADDREYGQSKQTPFETGVKIAASLGDYAIRRGHAVTLIDEEAPRGAVSADMLLQYLARVDQTSELSFAEQIGRIQQNTIAAVLPHPTRQALDDLVALKLRGHDILALLLDTASFPDADADAVGTPGVQQLEAAGIETHIIQHGDDWTKIIEEGAWKN